MIAISPPRYPGLLVFSLLFAYVHLHAWTSIEPRVTDHTLRSIFFLDSQNGWAAGEGGAIIHTSNGGASWKAQTTNTTDTLLDVFFSDPLRGWAVGRSGAALRTRDGGITWEKLLKRTNDKLIGVHFNGPDTGVFVSGGDNVLTILTADGGATWTNLVSAAEGRQTDGVVDVAFVSALDFWISGPQPSLLHTTDGGATWQDKTFWDTALRGYVQNIFFLAGRNGWFYRTDTKSVYRTRDGGETWSLAGGIGTMASDLMDPSIIAFKDADSGMILIDLGCRGVGRTSDGGQTWIPDPDFRVPTELLYAAAADRSGFYWVGGRYGALYTNRKFGSGIRAAERGTVAPRWGSTPRISVCAGSRAGLRQAGGQMSVHDLHGRLVSTAGSRGATAGAFVATKERIGRGE